MWTSEFEFDSTVITVMDDDAKEEDVTIELSVEHVDIRQFNPHLEKYDLITLSPKMMLEIIESFSHPEGMFSAEVSKTKLD